MQAKVAQNIPNALKWIGIGSTAMMLFVAAANPQTQGVTSKKAVESKSQTSAKANTGASPDVVQGKLFLATLFTIGGGADRPYLWIKSEGAQYEIVLTDKTSLPSDWRQKRDGDDTQYPVTLIGVGGTFYTEPEPESMQVTHKADGTISRRLNIHDSGSDHEHHVTTLLPLVGRYSVQGRIVVRSNDGETGQIAASEIKYLGQDKGPSKQDAGNAVETKAGKQHTLIVWNDVKGHSEVATRTSPNAMKMLIGTTNQGQRGYALLPSKDGALMKLSNGPTASSFTGLFKGEKPDDDFYWTLGVGATVALPNEWIELFGIVCRGGSLTVTAKGVEFENAELK
jgi:hypothetical protein